MKVVAVIILPHFQKLFSMRPSWVGDHTTRGIRGFSIHQNRPCREPTWHILLHTTLLSGIETPVLLFEGMRVSFLTCVTTLTSPYACRVSQAPYCTSMMSENHYLTPFLYDCNFLKFFSTFQQPSIPIECRLFPPERNGGGQLHIGMFRFSEMMELEFRDLSH